MNPELAKWEVFAKEILKRVNIDEDPGDLLEWMRAVVQDSGAAADRPGSLLWAETFEFYQHVIERRIEMAQKPESEQRVFDWPWSSWSNVIDPLGPGMLAVISAPDGQGKTMYAECIAEHWARHGNQVAFIHYELNSEVMLDRRAARHIPQTARQLRQPEPLRGQISEMDARLRGWTGGINFEHAAGWSMADTIARLRALYADGHCDAVVLDYLEKVAPTKRQIDLYGSNQYQREADNMEQIKTFAEQAGIPALLVVQMNKAGKGTSFENVDRTAMRGAGEKSEKANLVVLLHRDRTADGYSDTVKVLIDKNTMGPTCTFRQHMEPEFFRVGDITSDVPGGDVRQVQRGTA